MLLTVSRRNAAPIKCVQPVQPDNENNGGRAGTRTPDLLRVKQAL
jgi:hypothetical protein